MKKRPDKVPTLVSRRSIYKNDYVEVVVDTLSRGGRGWEYMHLVKPNKNCVAIVPMDETGVFLIHQYRYPVKKRLWQVIGGMIEKGDSEIATARKELHEEAGIVAGTLKKVGSFLGIPGASAERTILYVAKKIRFVKNSSSFREGHITLRHFTFTALQKMVARGEIECGFTLSSLFILKTHGYL